LKFFAAGRAVSSWSSNPAFDIRGGDIAAGKSLLLHHAKTYRDRDTCSNANISLPGPDDRDERNDNIVFSYIDGHVWMSWPGAVAVVTMGTYEAATAAMQGFLAQCELGAHLAKGPSARA